MQALSKRHLRVVIRYVTAQLIYGADASKVGPSSRQRFRKANKSLVGEHKASKLDFALCMKVIVQEAPQVAIAQTFYVE